MQVWIDRYLEWMQITNYSERSVKTRQVDLNLFNRWSEARGLMKPQDITKPILESYQRYLFYYRKPNGQPLTFGRQAARLISVKGLFKWLTRQNHILYNPASELILPRKEKRLPGVILNEGEVELLLSLLDTDSASGLRDRAILETLYSTGMRRLELVNLSVYDVDASRGTVFIRKGKGQKDRMVPIGERALSWIDRYLEEVRPQLLVDTNQLGLFLNRWGQSYQPDGLTEKVRRLLKKSELNKQGGCHLFRHSMATQMLENGADIRYIQELLGHATLESTQIYTHVSITQLKAIHRATHPTAKIKPD